MTSPRLPSAAAALESLAVPRIEHVDLVTVRLPFVAPFGTTVHIWTAKEAIMKRQDALLRAVERAAASYLGGVPLVKAM